MKNRSKNISEKDEEKILIKSAKLASDKALRVSSAMGLSVKIIKDNQIILINPDKTEKVIRTIEKSKVDLSKLKKGMILERK